MLGFIYLLCASTFVMFGLVMIYLYKRLYLRKMSYVIHKDVEKEVELPPLNNNMEFTEETVQEDPNVLLHISD